MVLAEFEGDAGAEVFVDRGASGLWKYDAGVWSQISGANLD
jgi:hypothetical protein